MTELSHFHQEKLAVFGHGHLRACHPSCCDHHRASYQRGGENRRSLHYAPPDFLLRFVTSANSMRLSLLKAAHPAVVEGCVAGNPGALRSELVTLLIFRERENSQNWFVLEMLPRTASVPAPDLGNCCLNISWSTGANFDMSDFQPPLLGSKVPPILAPLAGRKPKSHKLLG